MIVSILLLAVLVAVVAVVAARVRRTPAAAARTTMPGLRDLFTYLLLYVLVVVSALGTAGLAGQLLVRLTTDGTVAGSSVEAARNGAFVVVGLPLAALVAASVRRRLRTDPAERTSLAWAGYVSLMSLTALVVTAVSAHASLVWAFGQPPEEPRAVARTVVWALVWLAHRRLDAVLTPQPHRWPNLVAGSAIGLATLSVGAVGVVGNALDIALGVRVEPFTDPHDQILRATATLLVGAAVWAACWWAGAVRAPRGLLADGYALLCGAAGLVAAVVGTTWVLTDVLVRVLGDPLTTGVEHFDNTPHAATAALVGVALWAYHVPRAGRPGPTVATGRTEVHRLRDYGTAVLGVVTVAVGTGVLVAALVDALTVSATVAGTSAANVALVAVALLVAGVPTWWLGWRPALRAVAADAGPERVSPTRRTYLLGLTGTGLLVGVGALVGLVYVLFEDLFAGTVALGTLRDMRFALGVLVAAAAVVGTHVALARSERSLHVPARRALRYVVLVGPPDAGVGRAVATATGARVLSWPRTDGVRTTWPVDEVVRLVTGAHGPEVVVVATPEGLVAVPVDRGHGDVAAATVPAPHPSEVVGGTG